MMANKSIRDYKSFLQNFELVLMEGPRGKLKVCIKALTRYQHNILFIIPTAGLKTFRKAKIMTSNLGGDLETLHQPHEDIQQLIEHSFLDIDENGQLIVHHLTRHVLAEYMRSMEQDSMVLGHTSSGSRNG